MAFQQLVGYFMPANLRKAQTHPKYNELRTIVSTVLVALPLVLLFPILLFSLGWPYLGFLVNAALLVCILLSVKFFGHYRIPMSTTAMATYFIIYGWVSHSGYIYSPNLAILHMYLLGAIWADKKYGWLLIFSNIALFVFIYHQATQLPALPLNQHLGSPLYALVMNLLITVFLGGFFAYLLFDQEQDRAKIRTLQQQQINVLDQVVKERTHQLNNMREMMAQDFHDQTGNMLSAITRQASLLKAQPELQRETVKMTENIIHNSNELYASSKDFLWHLNHNSDDPKELFDYLTAHGQLYYNQFDIAFSASSTTHLSGQLAPSAALNLLYIFKEVMTNVVKHAQANEVQFQLEGDERKIQFSLCDDGQWTQPDQLQAHYGLDNISKRCAKNGFELQMEVLERGTTIRVQVPLVTLPIPK